MESWQKDIIKAQLEQVDYLMKSISGEIYGYGDIEKARSGIYENTPENRKLGRVGQKYGSKKEPESLVDEKYKTALKNASFVTKKGEFELIFSGDLGNVSIAKNKKLQGGGAAFNIDDSCYYEDEENGDVDIIPETVNMGENRGKGLYLEIIEQILDGKEWISKAEKLYPGAKFTFKSIQRTKEATNFWNKLGKRVEYDEEEHSAGEQEVIEIKINH